MVDHGRTMPGKRAKMTKNVGRIWGFVSKSYTLVMLIVERERSMLG